LCGICGFTGNNKELLRTMNASISHRGPDGDGFYEDKGISLGHRRLKIIDLSEKGKQPMSNQEGSIWITTGRFTTTRNSGISWRKKGINSGPQLTLK